MDYHLRPFVPKLWVVLLVVVGLLVVYFLTHELLMLFAASVLAILWRNSARLLSERTGIKPGLMLALVILLNYGLFVIAGFALAPRVAAQIDVLNEQLPQVLVELEASMLSTDVGRLIWRNLPDRQQLLGNGSVAMEGVLSFFTLTLGALLDVIIISVLAVFISINPLLYVRGFIRLIPTQHRSRAAQVLETLNVTLYRWFLGKILDMLTVGIMTAIGLWALGMPLILTFSLLAFLLSFIPNIGPLLSVIPPALVGFVEGPQVALYVLLLYLGIQTFESYFITPNIQKHAIQMPPVLLLVVQIIFAKLVGALGLLLSTPILATVIILVKMLYVEDTLGDAGVKINLEDKGSARAERLKPRDTRAKAEIAEEERDEA
ncbi:MAG: AI-2E family transporter [Catalinimonas sp.]